MQTELHARAIALGILKTGERVKECRHKHEASGTGGVFFDSYGILFCARCRGFQIVKRSGVTTNGKKPKSRATGSR